MNEKTAVNGKAMNNQPDCVSVTVRFISIMQKYSGNQREVEMELPTDPSRAVHFIINHFQIPWKHNLEKSTRIFINKTMYEAFVKSGIRLKAGDTIGFLPIAGGG